MNMKDYKTVFMGRHIFVFVLIAMLVGIMTFPLIFNLGKQIPAFFSSDESYAPIWDGWRIKYSTAHNLSLDKTFLINYPFGVDLRGSGYASYVWGGLIWFLNIIGTPILAYNIQVLANFFLMGVIIYLLALYLTNNVYASFFSAVIFAFCPYQFARTWQHLGLTYNQWIPLIIFSAIMLKDSDSGKNRLLFFLSVLLLLSFDWSIIYIAGVAFTGYLAYCLFYNWKTKISGASALVFKDLAYLKRVIIIGVISLTVFSPQFFPVVRNMTHPPVAKASAFNPLNRPFTDLFTQSAKPLSYLLPAAVHPVFGKFTDQFIGSPLYGVSYTEHTLYLGWVPIILAFIAYRKWRKNKKLRITNNEDFYIGLFVFLAIVAWLFSQPPYFTFPYFKVYMPSFFMYKILPMFRAYCRFGIVVMFAVSVLAGFGLKFILERFKSNRAKALFTSLVCGLALFEFVNFPPFKVMDLTKYPKVYDWLKNQDGDLVIAEYPLDTGGSNEYYKFCQTIHEKKIINGTIPGTHANMVAKSIMRLSTPETAGVLGWMKVKYVFVHLEPYGQFTDMEEVEEFEKIKTRRLPGLRFLQNVDDVDVYEVTARPTKPDVK